MLPLIESDRQKLQKSLDLERAMIFAEDATFIHIQILKLYLSNNYNRDMKHLVYSEFQQNLKYQFYKPL